MLNLWVITFDKIHKNKSHHLLMLNNIFFHIRCGKRIVTMRPIVTFALSRLWASPRIINMVSSTTIRSELHSNEIPIQKFHGLPTQELVEDVPESVVIRSEVTPQILAPAYLKIKAICRGLVGPS